MHFQRVPVTRPRTYKPHQYNIEPQEWSVIDKINWHQKIIVEVGCGKGRWICDQAKNKPANTYIGIERTQNKSKALIETGKRLALDNLVTIRADAIALIYHKFKQDSVSELYFFYPNPMCQIP